MLGEAEMSQAVNAVTSSSKRPYRKGHPLSDADKQRASVARKRATHKEVKVFLEPQLKELLMNMCQDDGLTQAEVLARLIEREAQARNIA
ncbi:replication regulatory protein RepA (plasmid) [Serratia marcescens]|nr:replication regulatory protein RepA [Serratia marcescens]MBH1913617.1 replication regulatory protein RepA [Serratia ureilytica]EIG9090089.1 replication regulatory protein RepA [Serratia marcescens]ELY1865345.1 replication regulatory protein RepA [Serratia marcescens]MBH3201849.1 replication regulatory protein RepA [Serratia marcescens]MBH3336921.1 replication regulatory protein RepA [Serratia marcescens]